MPESLNQQPSKPSPPEDGIAERIRLKRRELDLTVEQLAALTASFDVYANEDQARGVSVSTLYRYEKGDRQPGARELRLLAWSLDASPCWLLLGQEWDLEAEQDSKVANAFRGLVREVTEGEVLKQTNAWRREVHRRKLTEVKDSVR